MQQPVYAPFWNVRKGLVSHYIGMFTPASPAPDAFAGHKHFLATVPEHDIARLETQLLREAATAALPSGDGHMPHIICPVSYTTLLNRQSRSDYEQMAASIDSAVSARIGFLLFGFPPETNPGDITDMTKTLKKNGHMLLAEFPLDLQINFEALRASGFDAVGIHPQLDAKHRLRIGLQLDFFFTKARRNFIPYKFALGIPDLMTANEAICSGFDFLEGDCIMTPACEPAGMIELKQAEIYRKYFADRAE
jgi:hypothetical protein